MRRNFSITFSALNFVLLLLALTLTAMTARADDEHTSKVFQGVKANTGTVTHSRQGNQEVLTLSDDFQVPDAPAPHWQIVDSLGNTYLLQSLKIKGDKINKSIVVPNYIHDIARVQIWCAFAEALLGETTFESVITLNANIANDSDSSSAHDMHTSTPFKGVKANTGAVTHSKRGGENILTLSDDFKVPDAPAPHWQVVDSKGKVYLLQRLVAKGDNFHKTIVVPAYIPDIARVQIWCAYAQVLLGEASFAHPVK
jgi:hypothetical protein